MKILIAEDDGVSRILLRETLKKLNYDVTVVENGKQAWLAFESDYFPILISDWMMPELDGAELFRKIRGETRPKYSYLILLTSHGDKKSYLEGMSAGADDFIAKPFDEDQLAARLRVAERILSLQQEVHNLEEFLPICCYCKKIRDDKDYWQQIESYIHRKTGTAFSHGICPECAEKIVKPKMEELKRRGKPSAS